MDGTLTSIRHILWSLDVGGEDPEGFQAEKETVAPSPHQAGEVRVGFGRGRGPGLPESVKKSVMLLSKGKINHDAQDVLGMRIGTTARAAGADSLGRSLKSF